ncbi:epimerase [Pilimelia anulata]|uniref:Epimerase n=1 Tax=Pilimelia anulata TaxID=53371 RepID=A0A8J3B145_9ACTN|nr:saccharopine dehydrogenase [Pilimelia anulata]GGJ74983.1 epimerase [Pilimelia anulata]
MSRRPIGVVGGRGDVGSAAVGWLAAAGLGPVLVGGRHPRGTGCPASAYQQVDVADARGLAAFAGRCRLVVNCAGPAHTVGDRVALAALAAGADYVDAGGDDPLHAALDPDRYAAAGRVAVLSAGLRPGLTGLLPRWAARDLGPGATLRSHLAVRDAFTEVAAADYLAAAGGAARAAWRGGRVVAGALRRGALPALPHLDGPVTTLPYLDPEAGRVAAALRLADGEWYTALTGPHMTAAFDRAPALPRPAAVADLCRSSRLDLCGRPARVVLVVSVAGERERTVVVHAAGNAAVTGAVVGLTVEAVLAGAVPPGRHFAADVLDPAAAIARLTGTGAAALTVRDGVAADDVEEGTC